MQLSIPIDSDGFTSFVCPSCTRGFKVKPASPNPLKVCPYCAHQESESDAFFGSELREYVRVQAENAVIDQLKGGLLGDTVAKAINARPQALPPRPDEPESAGMASTMFTCCSEELRHDGCSAEVHCPSCGARKLA